MKHISAEEAAMKLLYAEDEPALSEAVVDYLTYHKYIVDAVYDGADAYDYAMTGTYDGIILDIMMPKRDGLEVLSALRRNGCRTPVLLLTAKTQVEDRIQGLDTGADDYLPKPFDMGELVARIRAMLRRREEYHPDLICFGDLTLNMQSGVISVGEMSFQLPKQEYRLMEQLMLHHTMYLSSESLLVKAWGYDAETDLSSVWLYISYLRKRLSAMNSGVEIVSKRNIGYKLEFRS
jgi:two-component system response regulator ArlR